MCVVNDAKVFYDKALSKPAPSLAYWTPLKMVLSTRMGEVGYTCYQTEEGTKLYCEFDADYHLFGKSFAVIATTVNLRSGPGTSYKILTKLDRGTIVAETVDGSEPKEADGYCWIKACLSDGTSGWIALEFLLDHRAWTLFSDLDKLALAGDMTSLECQLRDHLNESFMKPHEFYQEEEMKYFASLNEKYIIYVNSVEYEGMVAFGEGEGLCGGFYYFTPQEVMWAPNSKYYMIYRHTAGYTPGGLLLYQVENNHRFFYEYIGNTSDNSLPRFCFSDDDLFLWVDYSTSEKCMPSVWAYDMLDDRKILLLEPDVTTYRERDNTEREWEVQLVPSAEAEKEKERLKALFDSEFFKLYYKKWILCGWSEA
jgi:hypothetical protein